MKTTIILLSLILASCASTSSQFSDTKEQFKVSEDGKRLEAPNALRQSVYSNTNYETYQQYKGQN